MVTKFFSSFGYVLNGQVFPIQSCDLIYQAPAGVDPHFNNLLLVLLQPSPMLFDGAPQQVITTPAHIVVLFPFSYPNYIRREFEQCL